MQPPNLMLRLTIQTAITLIVMAGLLFGAAGTAFWPQAWTFLAIFTITSAGFGLWLQRRDPGLLAARLSSPLQQGQPIWDKLFLLIFILIWLGWLALMGLDAMRWRSSVLPIWLNILGGVLVVTGFLGVCRVFEENSFAAPVVRIQSERGQRVIDTGPYAIVRHPMYAAGLIYLFGLPLLLGSWYGLAMLPLFLAGLIPRAILEERTLQNALSGYADYRRRVRYRLLPGIW